MQNLDIANAGTGEYPNREPQHEAFLTQTAGGVVVEYVTCVNAMQREKVPRCSEGRTICPRKGSDDHKCEDLRD